MWNKHMDREMLRIIYFQLLGFFINMCYLICVSLLLLLMTPRNNNRRPTQQCCTSTDTRSIRTRVTEQEKKSNSSMAVVSEGKAP